MLYVFVCVAADVGGSVHVHVWGAGVFPWL